MTDSTVNNAKDVMKVASELFDERDHYEKVTLARTNKELYGILTKVYSLYKSAESSNCMQDVIKEMSMDIEVRGMKVQKNTPKLTIFVRHIFNCDRKRAYKYVKVIESAIQSNVAPTLLSEFINKHKGIENIKSEQVKTPEKMKLEVELESTIMVVEEELAKLTPIETVNFGRSVDLGKGADYTLVIARKNSKGTLDLLQPIPNVSKSMQSMAIKAIAKHVVENNDVLTKRDDKKSSLNIREQVMNSLKPKS